MLFVKAVSPLDASVLALIAEKPAISHDKLELLLADVEDEQVKEIARYLAGDLKGAPSHIVKAAETLRRWVRIGRERHAFPGAATGRV